MATAQDISDTFLRCVICTEKYTDPCTLRCHHSFCRKCICQYLQTKQESADSKSISCPICRKPTAVPDPSQPVSQWAEQIQSNPIVLGLIEKTGAETEEMKICILCKAKGGTSQSRIWCHVCDIAMCDSCAKTHSLIPSSREHEVSDLSKDLNVKIKRKVKCKEHPKQDIEFCCKNCEKAMCQTCCILYHRKCDVVVTIESVIPEMRGKLRERSDNLSKKVKDINTDLSRMKILVTETQTHKKEVQEKLELACQHAHDLITKKKEELSQALSRKTKERTAALQDVIQSKELITKVHKQMVELIDKTLETRCDMAIYDMVNSILSDPVSEPSAPTYSPMEPHFTIELGSDFESLASVLENSLYLNTVNEGSFNPNSKPVLHDIIEAGRCTDIVVLLVNGITTCVVTDHKKKHIQSIYFKVKDQFYSGDRVVLDDYAWGITKVSDSEIAVTIPKEKKILRFKVTPELSLLSDIKTDGGYYGLASVNQTTFAVGSSDKSAIDIIDMSGHVLKTIANTYTKYPNYIRKSYDSNLLVSDWGSKSVYSLSAKGKEKFVYSPQNEMSLRENRGIQQIKCGHILFVDKEANKIILLSEDGKYVRDILTRSDGIEKPYSLYVHQGLLYVTQDNGLIKIYRFE